MVELDIGYVKSGDILAKTQEFIKICMTAAL